MTIAVNWGVKKQQKQSTEFSLRMKHDIKYRSFASQRSPVAKHVASVKSSSLNLFGTFREIYLFDRDDSFSS